MRHRIAVLLGFAILCGLSCTTWLLVSGPLAHLFRSPAESYLGMLTIMIVCLSLVAAIVVSVWDATQQEFPEGISTTGSDRGFTTEKGDPPPACALSSGAGRMPARAP